MVDLTRLHLNPGVTQLLLVIPQPMGCGGELIRFSRTSAGDWRQEFNALAVVIGKNGICVDKQEGDNTTPGGLFALGTAFGRQIKPDWLDLDYRQLTADDKFIDDPEHRDYNRWIRGASNAKSYETMLREDGLYDLGVVVEYNVAPVTPGSGSAIFIHIWRGPGQGTEGCIGLAFADLQLLCRWLKKSAQPHIYIRSTEFLA